MQTKHEINPQVNHPKHYNSLGATTKSGEDIECIDVIQHMNLNRGNTVKYFWRAGIKDPAKELEDCKKARFYAIQEVIRLKNKMGLPILPEDEHKGNE